MAPMTRSEMMARVRSRNTKPELRLRRAIWGLGLRYRVATGLPGRPDLVFGRARVCVFVDGCFWHRCPAHYRAPATNRDFWAAKAQRNVERDRLVDHALQELGFTVVHIWSHDLASTRAVEQAASRVRDLVAVRTSALTNVSARTFPPLRSSLTNRASLIP